MSDIISRLRSWVHAVHAAPASDLMDEAADEIARLRMTDAEREAVEKAAWYVEAMASGDLAGTIPPTLRALLERTK